MKSDHTYLCCICTWDDCIVDSCVLPHQGRALWDEHTATMETGVSQLQV